MSALIRNAVRRMVRELEARPTFDASAMYFRSVALEIGFRNAATDALKAQYGYSYLYPQSFAFDEHTGELFVMLGAEGGANPSLAWFQVYDFATGALKSTFTTGEEWREACIIRYVGGGRRLYTINKKNQFYSVDLSILPADKGTTGAITVHLPDCYSVAAYDGKTFTVQNWKGSRSQSRRHRFTMYDADTFAVTGSLVLPFDSVGSLGAYMGNLPKMQGIAAYDGCYFIASGAAYVPGVTTDPSGNGRLAGIQAFTATGEKIAAALSSPEEMRAVLQPALGYLPSCVETEGLAPYAGGLYSLWVTLGPADRENPANAGKGIVITREMARGPDRLDFRATASGNRLTCDMKTIGVEIAHSATQLTNPITGAPLTTFQEIITYMNDADLPVYRFGGTNQSIKDLNGITVNVSGRLVECFNINGSSFIFKVTGNNLGEVYWVAGATQTKDIITRGGAGDRLMNGIKFGADGVAKIAMGRNTVDLVSLFEFFSPGQDVDKADRPVGRIATKGKNTRYYVGDLGFVTGGAGSPEGVIEAPAGSLYVREDGDGNNSLYFKPGTAGTVATAVGWMRLGGAVAA